MTKQMRDFKKVFFLTQEHIQLSNLAEATEKIKQHLHEYLHRKLTNR
jgi:hypothetical protein